MPTFTQRDRPLRLTTPLGEDALLLERVRGVEAMSALFHFELDLLSEKKDIDPKLLLGKSVTIEIDFGGDDGKTRYINGICSRIAQGGRDMRLVRYHAEVVPKLWIGTRTRNSRIFQSKTVPEVLQAVLKDLGVEVKMEVAGTMHPRNYLTQYNETDFAFLSRLMEEEGIFYYHLHSNGKHELVLANTPNLPTVPDPGATVKVMPGGLSPMAATDPLAFSITRESSVVTHKITMWDHSFELPTQRLDAERAVVDSAKVGDASTEIYEYPGAYAQRFDGVDKGGGEQASELQKIFEDNARTAGIRAQELAAPQTEMRGSCNCPMLTAGHKFTLAEHYRSDFNGPYVLTRVTHSASVENYENAQGSPFEYTNGFECIPAAIPYRPQRVTPRARIYGAQTAVVVGPPGAEIFTDKYGRVKVQFHWNREGQKDAGSSCWVRWRFRGWGARWWSTSWRGIRTSR